MLNLGFAGAFVVAFYKDRRISMQEALDLQAKTQKNVRKIRKTFGASQDNSLKTYL